MTIAEFLIALATDDELLRKFAEEPEGIAREAGLSEAQRNLLLSGTLRELRVKITAEFEVEGEIVAYQTIYKPPPPPPPHKS
jgi:hypothetical protein